MDLTEHERQDDADTTSDAAREAESLRSHVYDGQTEINAMIRSLNDTEYDELDEISGKLQAMAELAGEVASILEGIEREAAQRLSDHEED